MMNELNVVNIRLVNEPSLYSEKELKSPEAVLELMASEMASYDREVLCVLNLKANGQVINMNECRNGECFTGQSKRNIQEQHLI